MSERDRVRWHCRRGLLELDLVLAEFLARHFDGLPPRDVERFKELLEQPDNALLDLVMGWAEPANSECRPVLELLRASRVAAGTMA